jgi:hypothetical protein
MSRAQRVVTAIAFGLLLELASGSAALAQAGSAVDAASRAPPDAFTQPEATPTPTVPTASADPPADVQATYREVVTHAVSEFDAGRAAEARALFLRAHELWPSARTLRTLGMTAFELRMYPRALEELQGALDDARRPLPDDQRAQVLSLIAQTRAFVGRYRVQLSPPEAELQVDGAPRSPNTGTLVLAVGDHVLLVRAQGYGDLRQALTVQGREDQELTIKLEPLASATAPGREPIAGPKAGPVEPAPAIDVTSFAKPNRTPAFIAFGVGAAGLAVGTISGLIAISKQHDVNGESGFNRAADISTAAFITAGVAAVVGTVLLITASAPDAPKDNAAESAHTRARFIRPTIGLGGVGIEGRL